MSSKRTATAAKPQQSRRAARAAELARQERRRRVTKISVTVGLAAVLVVVGVFALGSQGSTSRTDASGQDYIATKENFRLPGLLDENATVALADFKGTPVVVNFFASWCVYCNEELPGFVQVAQATTDQVAFVGVDTNDPGDGAAMANRFDLAGAGFHLAHDIGDDPASELWLSYGSQGLPVTAFYDANGTLVDFAGGMLTQAELQQRLNSNFGVDVTAPDASGLVAPVIPLIPQGAYELLSRNAGSDSFAAIDLRPASEYAKGHIEGALNIEATPADVVAKAKDLDKSGSWFLYDASGTDAEAVANALHDAGYKHVYFIQGGWTAWTSGGFPATT